MKRIATRWTKAFVMLLLVLSTSGRLFSQQVPTVIPPSPNAANLGNFINTPIGHYTGTPAISVPIWTIKEGQISIPISLSYKAGIKAAEIASSVGLGWVLNAGGAITRSVVGLSDETPSWGYLYSLFPPQCGSEHGCALGVALGTIDGQQDQFFYNLPGGGSGRFIFDKNQVAHTIPKENYKINPVETQHMLFFNGFATQFTKWTVKDDKGILYKFNDFEKTSTITTDAIGGSTGIDYSVNTWYLTEIVSPTGDIVTFTYEDVEMDYDLPGTKTHYIKTAGGGNELPNSDTYMRQLTNVKRLTAINFSNGKIEFIPTSTGRADLIGDKALDKIVVKDKAGNIVKQFQFTYQYLVGTSMLAFNAINFTGENNHLTTPETNPPPVFKRRLMLQQIVEQDKNGVALNNGHLFDYIHDWGLPNRATKLMDHWGYANKEDDPLAERPQFVSTGAGGSFYLTNKAANSLFAKQGTLKKVTYPTGGFTVYEYEGNTAGVSPTMPTEIIHGTLATLPFSHGSYNFQESFEYEERLWMGAVTRHYYVPFNLNLPSTVVTFKLANVPSNPSGEFGFYVENVLNPGVRIWTGTNNGQQNMILQPGQYRLYHYPSPAILANTSHQYYGALYEASVIGSFEWTPPNPDGPYPAVGGIRVKKVKNYDPVANNTLIKTYTYELDGSSGHLVSTPVYVYNMDMTTATDFQSYKICTYNSVYPLSTTHGSYVGYEQVEEKILSVDNIPLGKTEYNFISPAQQPDLFYKHGNVFFPDQVYPNPPVDNRDWLRGFMTRQEDFKYVNNAYVPVKRVFNTYSKFIDSVSRGIKMDITARHHNGGASFAYNYYYIYSGYIYPGETLETVYNGAEEITTRTTMTYSHKSVKPAKQSQYRSDGTIAHSFNSYPLDYPSGTPFIDNLVTKNIVSVPIEIVKAAEPSAGVINILDGSLKTYRLDNALPDDDFGLETSLVPQASFKFSNAAAGQLPTANPTAYAPDSRYKLVIKYNAYDAKGNLTEVQKADDVKQSYVWGYESKLPIAQATNALAKDIFHTSFEEADGNSSDGDSKTGRKSRTNGYSKSLAGLTNGLYILTYWQKSGSVWNLQKGLVSVSAGTASINIAGQVDELRFHPRDAHMSTYTYDPLIGMISQADIRNYVMYYEYDLFTRLLRIRDPDKNIIKQWNYEFTSFDHSGSVWQLTGNTRCKPCPANASYTTNVRQDEERDMNPASATYNQLRWVDNPSGPTCWLMVDWQATGNTRCAKDGTNNNTGYIEREERDMNPCSPTYNQLRWYEIFGQNCAVCPKVAAWTATGNLRCVKNGSNQNTGFQEREERDNESCSPTYNQLRWVNIGQNLSACPLPANCTPANCSGVNKKCINGVCETGVKMYFGGPQIGPNQYQCSYAYFFSDGTYSQTFTEINSTPCPNDFEG